MRLYNPHTIACLELISLILVGCGGNTSSTPSAVAALVPSFTAPSGPLTVGQSASFSDTSTGNPTAWAWSFGDGGTSTVKNPTHTYAIAGTFTVRLSVTNAGGSASASKMVSIVSAPTTSYTLVDTGQTQCFDASTVITAPTSGTAFFGQDAQFSGTQPSFTLSSDGLTVHDNATGLIWQRSPDTNGDGVITASDKLSWTMAQTRPATLNSVSYGGYSDWRLPTIKELYSLMNFTGTDPSGVAGTDTSSFTPFIDRGYFKFAYGDTSARERIIDSQYATSTLYVSKATEPLLFGVNFADGRIKGYGLSLFGQDKTFSVQCVRGSAYGVNNFADNGDGTVTDQATGLMWTKTDSGKGLNWQEALAWTQSMNAAGYLGHADWRLPNAKELQSLVDYTRSPDTTASAAINPLFTCTGITNEAGMADFPCYWTSTTHMSSGGTGHNAIYVAFGRAMGYVTDPSGANGRWMDVHGAGAQRSDPKRGNPADFPTGFGPQGDAIRIYNYVRLVREAK